MTHSENRVQKVRAALGAEWELFWRLEVAHAEAQRLNIFISLLFTIFTSQSKDESLVFLDSRR